MPNYKSISNNLSTIITAAEHAIRCAYSLYEAGSRYAHHHGRVLLILLRRATTTTALLGSRVTVPGRYSSPSNTTGNDARAVRRYDHVTITPSVPTKTYFVISLL